MTLGRITSAVTRFTQQRLMSRKTTKFKLQFSKRSISNWQKRIEESEVIFFHEQDVQRFGMLDLYCACNTAIIPKYDENSPYADKATVKFYGKSGHGKSVKDLKEILDSVNSINSIIRFISEGKPQLLKVKFPYLQKYKSELRDCFTCVVEMPIEFDMVSQVTQNSNLFIKGFENEIIHAFADLGEMELSKLKCKFAECYTGGNLVSRDHYTGSGQFRTMLKGGVYFKKMLGGYFSLYSDNGNLVTDSVYAKDIVYCAEQGDVIAGTVQSNGCHLETYNGVIKVGSLTTDDLVGRITESGNFDLVVEKSTKMLLTNEKQGGATLKLNPSVKGDLVINSKSSSVSSELDFTELEKKDDPVRKYEVVTGKIGEGGKELKCEAHQGHIRIEKGDWMSTMKLKLNQ